MISVIYGGLTLAASIIAIVNNMSPVWSNIMMALSSLLLIIMNHKKYCDRAGFVVIPLFFIQISAFMNGLAMGGINISHHMVRLLISLLVFTLFYLSKNNGKVKE